MQRRVIVGTLAGAALLGVVTPSYAMSSPVTVKTSTSNGVSAGVGAFGEPVVGASVSSGGNACVGFSYQVPFCTGN